MSITAENYFILATSTLSQVPVPVPSTTRLIFYDSVISRDCWCFDKKEQQAQTSRKLMTSATLVATYCIMAVAKRTPEFASGKQHQCLENEEEMEKQVY